MEFRIITEAPGWMALLCAAAGLIAALILYRKNSSLQEIPRSTVLVMSGLRFFSVMLIAFLLMTPLIRTVFNEIEKPLLIVLQDGSASVTGNPDSTTAKKQIDEGLNGLISTLDGDFEVRTFTIGDHIREGIDLSFRDRQTDLSEIIPELKARFTGRNTGAIILATDGLYNTGANPLYTYELLNTPVFTVGLGDTTVRKDLLISGLRYNRTVYKGNTFPVEITIDARRLKDENAELTLFKGSEKVYSSSIRITSQRFNTLVPVFLDANEKGTLQYRVKLSRLSGEVNYSNNEAGFYIDVTENRQKVLLLGNSPHPDLGFINDVLERTKTYEITSLIISDFDGNVTGYNLVILHQLPGLSSSGTQIIESCRNAGIPIWFILGSQSNVSLFNSLKAGINISDNRGNIGEIQADPSQDFSAFTFEEQSLKTLSQLPPLTIPFGTYSSEGETAVLLKQRIGQVKSGMPMLAYIQKPDTRTAILCGEGIWKWGLAEYAMSGNKEATSGLVVKTVQYLASGRKTTPFRVFMKNDYSENEQIIADAELYNASGELVNQPEVSMTFMHDDGRKFNFVFSRTEKSYLLNAGFMPTGKYRYSSTVSLGKNTFTETGVFTISELLAEQSETIADHQLLRTISTKTGGNFFQASQFSVIADSLRSRIDIRPVSYERRKLDDLLHLKWYFFLLAGLLALEWFLRKRSGIY